MFSPLRKMDFKKHSTKDDLPTSRDGEKEEVYRNTTGSWLIGLLEKGEMKPQKNQFISFTASSKKIEEFGDIQIIFDFEKLEKQGIEPIDYDDIENFGTDPKVVEYVTGYGFETEEDYYNEFDLGSAEEAHAQHELSWEDFVDTFRKEEELILKKVSYEPGLILKVRIPRNPLRLRFHKEYMEAQEYQDSIEHLIEVLEQQNIIYELI